MADYLRLDDDKKQQVDRVGRAGMLIVEATFDLAATLEPLRKAMAKEIATAQSVSAAEERVADILISIQDSDALGDALFVPFIMADMAGQLMVHGIEAETTPLGKRLMTFAADGSVQPDGSFLELPWDEAIAEFKARGLVSDQEFSRMLRNYAERSKEARALMLQRLQNRMRELLEQAVEQDQTFDEFAEAVADGTAKLGISEQDPAYLQTVFRTNIQSAYGAGRFRAANAPEVLEARPYSQYLTVNDIFVRPSHAKLHNRVYKTDSDAWRKIAPPNGFNCRCSSSTLTREEAKTQGIRRVIPKGGEPDPEFEGPPVKNVEEPMIV